MSKILQILLGLLVSSTGYGVEACFTNTKLHPKYSSFWVEPLYESGFMREVLDFELLLGLRNDRFKELSALRSRAAELKNNVPTREMEYKSYLQELFDVQSKIDSIAQEPEFLGRNAEEMEKLFIYKYVYEANELIASEVLEGGLCIGQQEFSQMVMKLAKKNAALAIERALN